MIKAFLDQKLISYRYSSCSFLVVLLVGATSSKSRCFKWDRDEILQECSSCKYA